MSSPDINLQNFDLLEMKTNTLNKYDYIKYEELLEKARRLKSSNLSYFNNLVAKIRGDDEKDFDKKMGIYYNSFNTLNDLIVNYMNCNIIERQINEFDDEIDVIIKIQILILEKRLEELKDALSNISNQATKEIEDEAKKINDKSLLEDQHVFQLYSDGCISCQKRRLFIWFED